MSQLWACYVADNVERFRRLLALTGHSAQAAAVWNANQGGVGGGGGGAGTPTGAGDFATSPRTASGKQRKASSHGAGAGVGSAKAGAAGAIGKAEINSRDHAGLTILLRAAGSSSDNALAFVQALLEHPAIDIYLQDPESGWNALHRALYAGNISIARLLLDKERKDMAGQTLGAPVGRTGQLIKTKDHEGNSPFDLYNSVIGERFLDALHESSEFSDDDSDSNEPVVARTRSTNPGSGMQSLVDGEDLFFFGSNKNLTLGLGDEDDRQFPERVYLKRPDHLIRRFYEEHLAEADNPVDLPADVPRDVTNIPTLIQGRPLLIHDVVLSKLHSAVLTADPVSNLYVCGIGRGGRLGLGDENTRFSFEPVQGLLADKRVVQVALGQNHTMAVTEDGGLWTWGSNALSQLGYSLPPPAKRDEDPMSTTPRQVFGPLRKEAVLGVAASALHSVAHTGSSLYCWGKNAGQLALMDADSRSLDVQPVPRKVAASLFSSAIVAVSAIDKATTCLLANHTVCVFTSYGYNMVRFPFAETMGANARLAGFYMSSRYDAGRSQISYIASGGETIAAVTGRGDLFTMNLTSVAQSNRSDASSTTNPSKIRGALTQPQCIWSASKDGVRSVDVGEQGSVIISTHSGAVWRRVKRAKAKDAHVSGLGGRTKADPRKKDYKFQRVPFITNVATVRSSAFGAFAAIRSDSDVIKEQTMVDEQTLWDDILPLNVLRDFTSSVSPDHGSELLQFWNTETIEQRHGPIAYQVMRAPELEKDLQQYLADWIRRGSSSSSLGVEVCSSLYPDVRIPVHSWLLSARSSVLREALAQCRRGDGPFELPDILSAHVETAEGSGSTVTVLSFSGLDLISLLNLVLFVYEDKVIPVWNYARQSQPMAHRYRQVRLEVMKIAARLIMPHLEAAVRIQTKPKRCMDADFGSAIRDDQFFDDADTILELNGAEVPVHSAFLCQRCPWFEGLFHGRSGGRWLTGRRQAQGATDKVRLDLKHMDPDAFQRVLQFLYADSGPELFDALVSPTLEAFFDSVLEVLSIANELMLDRLSQICQRVIGQFANTLNVSQLLNTMGACSVSEFKDAGLEYICLQMETMLENHLLDDLDEDLLRELDLVVRDNQLTQLPFSKSGRAELELLQKYPELAQDIDEERQRRVREMAFKATQRDDDRRQAVSTSFKSRVGSVDNNAPLVTAGSPTPERNRRKSRGGRRGDPSSPVLAPKTSHADLIFSMEEEDAGDVGSSSGPLTGMRPRSKGVDSEIGSDMVQTRPATRHEASGRSDFPPVAVSRPRGSMVASSPLATSAAHLTPITPPPRQGPKLVLLGEPAGAGAAPTRETASGEAATATKTENSAASPWGPPSITSPASALDLRAIMTETSLPFEVVSRKSALSAGLHAQRCSSGGGGDGAGGDLGAVSPKPTTAKMSQKERKKKKQQEMQQLASSSNSGNMAKGPAWDKSDGKRPAAAPWQAAQSAAGRATQQSPAATPLASALPASVGVDEAQPGLSPTPLSSAKKRAYVPRAASPDTRFSGQARPLGGAGRSGLSLPAPGPGLSHSPGSGSRSVPPSSTQTPTSAAPILVPHSKVYIRPPPKAEPVVGLSMADIFVQQQLEQESVREAVAKRSLQEIQQEQAFQEWWEQESRRAQEEEARRVQGDGTRRPAREKAEQQGGNGRAGRGGGGGGGRGGGRKSSGSMAPGGGPGGSGPGGSGPGGSRGGHQRTGRGGGSAARGRGAARQGV